jgi:hypothetical protein
MKCIVAFSIILSLFGCASSTVNTVDPDYFAVARIALAEIEPSSGTDIIVAAPEITAMAKAALVKLGRTVIEPVAVPYCERDSLPPGYLLLKRFEISADGAIIDITRGPVGHAVPPWTCGEGYKMSLLRTTGEWRKGTFSTTVC